jgi:DNA-binding response OmpR family regulator
VTKQILVVDDRAVLLDLLRRVLEDEQYRVSVLQEGREAVHEIRNNPPDLVILDLKLQDVDGMDVLQELRASSSTMDVPVIVYTAAVIEAEAVANLVRGNPLRYANVAVLQKPFELDGLIEKVQEMLGSTRPD